MKFLSRRRSALRRSSTTASLSWNESTSAEHAWDRARAATGRWAVAGAVVGALVACLVYAPANWLARAVSAASGHHLVLAEARGSIWSGSAVAVLTGGVGSRDAVALPGRLEWSLGFRGTAFEVLARQACCLNGSVALRVQPGLSGWRATLVPPSDWVGRWPSAWLGGLGTPWNTLQLGGVVRLMSPGLTFERIEGRWGVVGEAQAELLNASSRLSTLETLGSYRLRLVGAAANAGQPRLELSTYEGGALHLSGAGTWGPDGVYFRGEARASVADEVALNNLLNIIGRRNGARSIISIG